MKKATWIVAGLAGAGVISYIMINKKTRRKAEKLLDSMLDEADTKIKSMNN